MFDFEVTWPHQASRKDLYDLKLIGAKTSLCKEKMVMKYFLANIDPDTFCINGTKLFQIGRALFETPTQFKFANDCCHANVYEYHKGTEYKVLVTEVVLNSVLRDNLSMSEKVMIIEKQCSILFNMVPDAGEKDVAKISTNFFGGANYFQP